MANKNNPHKEKKTPHKKKKTSQNQHLRPHELKVLQQQAERLLNAVRKGDVEAAQQELAEGASANGSTMVTPLHYAAYYGKLDVMKVLVKFGADLEAYNNCGHVIGLEGIRGTPLCWAFEGNHPEVAMWLIGQGANVNIPLEKTMYSWKGGNCPTAKNLLLLALAKGWSDIAVALIEHGADITIPAEYGQNIVRYSALDLAAYYNCLEPIRMLLKRGMDGTHALFMAIEQGHAEAAQLLLRSRIDLHARNRHGDTIPYEALHHKMYWLVEYWLTHGGDPNLQNRDGSTLLHYAFGASNYQELQPMAHLLRRYGADLGIQDERGTTPLHWAARHGLYEWVEVWINKGGDLNIHSETWGTPLFAALPAHPDVALLLIRHGASLNERGNHPDDQGKTQWTPLHVAADAGLTEVVQALLEHGAEVNPVNDAGETPLAFAINAGHLEIVNYLCVHGATVSASFAPEHRAIQDALLFLAGGVIPDVADVEARYLELVNTLLEHEILHIPNKAYCQPELNDRLREAVLNNMSLADVDTWITLGAELNQADDYGFTPLHYATERGELLLSRLLVQHGADVRAATAYGYTPLHYAARHDNRPLVTLLLEAGAHPAARVSRGRLQGWTALHFAFSYHHPRVVQLLAPVSPRLSTLVNAGSHAITGKYKAYHHSQPRLKDDIEHVAFRCPECHEFMLYNVGFEMDGSGVHADRQEYFLCGNCEATFLASGLSLRRQTLP